MAKASTRAASSAMTDEARGEFIEQFGIIWSEMGNPRADGRVFAYLTLSDQPYVSTAELSTGLQISAGTISGATRRLSDGGIIQRVGVPGERSHFYRAVDDCWGAFLQQEYKQFHTIVELADSALGVLGDTNEHARARVQDTRDYFEWLLSRRTSWADEWIEFRNSRTHQPKLRWAGR